MHWFGVQTLLTSWVQSLHTYSNVGFLGCLKNGGFLPTVVFLDDPLSDL